MICVAQEPQAVFDLIIELALRGWVGGARQTRVFVKAMQREDRWKLSVSFIWGSLASIPISEDLLSLVDYNPMQEPKKMPRGVHIELCITNIKLDQLGNSIIGYLLGIIDVLVESQACGARMDVRKSQSDGIS